MNPAPSPQSQSPDSVHSRSLADPEGFWSEQAQYLFWEQKPEAALHTSRKALTNSASYPTWTWFPGGKISTCYNCIDRHVDAGRGEQVAIFYDSPVTGSKDRFTYKRLLEEVETLAGALREKGIRKGDVVMLYRKCALEPSSKAFADSGSKCP